MLVIQKANTQLKINDNELDAYLAQGYSQVDNETGEVIKVGQATDLEDIKAENSTLKAKLAEYKDSSEKLDQLEAILAENEALKAQVAELSKSKK